MSKLAWSTQEASSMHLRNENTLLSTVGPVLFITLGMDFSVKIVYALGK